MNKKYKNGRNGRVGFRKINPKIALSIRISSEAYKNYFEINKLQGKGGSTKVIEGALKKHINEIGRGHAKQ